MTSVPADQIPAGSGPADGATDLRTLADDLLGRASRDPARRAAHTLPHPVEGLRQTVIALCDGATMHEHNSPGPASVQVLRGAVRVVAGDTTGTLRADQHAPVPPGRHSLQADGDTVVLLSVALAVATDAGQPDSLHRQG